MKSCTFVPEAKSAGHFWQCFSLEVEPDVWTQKGSEPDSIPSCGEDFSGYNTSGCILPLRRY